MLRIALVDGDVAIRAGRKMMIESRPDFQLVYEESDARIALEKIPDLLVDALVIDHRLKGFNGLELTSKLVVRFSEKHELCPPVIITGTYATSELVLSALRCGASDVITQDAPMAELLRSLENLTKPDSNLDFTSLADILNHADYRAMPNPMFMLHKGQLNSADAQLLEAFGSGKSLDGIRLSLGIDENAIRIRLNQLLINLRMATPEQLYLAMHDAEAA